MNNKNNKNKNTINIKKLDDNNLDILCKAAEDYKEVIPAKRKLKSNNNDKKKIFIKNNNLISNENYLNPIERVLTQSFGPIVNLNYSVIDIKCPKCNINLSELSNNSTFKDYQFYKKINQVNINYNNKPYHHIPPKIYSISKLTKEESDHISQKMKCGYCNKIVDYLDCLVYRNRIICVECSANKNIIETEISYILPDRNSKKKDNIFIPFEKKVESFSECCLCHKYWKKLCFINMNYPDIQKQCNFCFLLKERLNIIKYKNLEEYNKLRGKNIEKKSFIDNNALLQSQKREVCYFCKKSISYHDLFLFQSKPICLFCVVKYKIIKSSLSSFLSSQEPFNNTILMTCECCNKMLSSVYFTRFDLKYGKTIQTKICSYCNLSALLNHLSNNIQIPQPKPISHRNIQNIMPFKQNIQPNIPPITSNFQQVMPFNFYSVPIQKDNNDKLNNVINENIKNGSLNDKLNDDNNNKSNNNNEEIIKNIPIPSDITSGNIESTERESKSVTIGEITKDNQLSYSDISESDDKLDTSLSSSNESKKRNKPKILEEDSEDVKQYLEMVERKEKCLRCGTMINMNEGFCYRTKYICIDCSKDIDEYKLSYFIPFKNTNTDGKHIQCDRCKKWWKKGCFVKQKKSIRQFVQHKNCGFCCIKKTRIYNLKHSNI